jgi:ferredoxin
MMITAELPLVDPARCTGCGDCMAVCPTACLEMNAFLPWLPRPCSCVSCNLCVLVCPVDAIRLAQQDS